MGRRTGHVMRTIRRESELPQTGDVFIFGAGKAGETVFDLVANNPDLRILGFVDNGKTGVLRDLPILSFDAFLAGRGGSETVMIASMYVGEISRQLKDAGVGNLINAYPILQNQRYERRRAYRAAVTAAGLLLAAGFLLARCVL